MKYVTRLYSEILNEVRQAKTREEKIKLLTENKNEDMHIIFKLSYGNLDSPYRNNVPEYTPDDSPQGMSYTSLHHQIPRLKYFFNSKFLIENEDFRTKKLKNILEMMHFSESALLENIFNKNLDSYGIDKNMIIEVYPELAKDLG